ncbi:MAG: DUF4202 domain-containing protein [Reichenbachiella sp.]
MNKLQAVLNSIDEVNKKDPNIELWEGKEHPKELIYSQRMSEMLTTYNSDPSDELQIAARGQHIMRWHIARSSYSMDRPGYLKWRTMLKLHHGEVLSGIMGEQGYDATAIDKVVGLVTKKKLKSDLETKELEDVVCLVFLKYHLDAFITKHEEAKIIDIIQKTWGKMTNRGHEWALKLDFQPESQRLVQAALS